MKFLVLYFSFFISATLFAQKNEVLTASATSSDATSASIECLLTQSCQGSWSPDADDAGIDEGIYIQLKQQTRVDYIEIDLNKSATQNKISLLIYLNGKTTNPSNVVYENKMIENKNTSTTTVLFGGRNNEHWRNLSPMQTEMKSFFVKIESSKRDKRPRVNAIRFYQHSHKLIARKKPQTKLPTLDRLGDKFKGRLVFKFPKRVKASLSATSILPPINAYHPANLFDSKYDFAWSTNGKKTSGIDESVTLKFSRNQNLKGFIIWNGYQRSRSHFNRNSAIHTMTILQNSKVVEKVTVKNSMGPQTILFQKVLKDTVSLTFKISQIRKGSSYKDVLISEIRFIDEHDRLILPQIKKPVMQLSKNWQALVDKSWSGFLHALNPQQEECTSHCYNKRIRLRSNGTFVIYKDFDYGSNWFNGTSNTAITAAVMEGNWEPQKNKIRIFGKKYTTSLRSSEYMSTQKDAQPTAAIFQSILSAKRYNKLSNREQKKLIKQLWSLRKGRVKSYIYPMTFASSIKNNPPNITGNSYKKLIKRLKEDLKRLNPLFISSSVLDGLFLPSFAIRACTSGC